jgi:hypothetical protein
MVALRREFSLFRQRNASDDRWIRGDAKQMSNENFVMRSDRDRNRTNSSGTCRRSFLFLNHLWKPLPLGSKSSSFLHHSSTPNTSGVHLACFRCAPDASAEMPAMKAARSMLSIRRHRLLITNITAAAAVESRINNLQGARQGLQMQVVLLQ